jgi:hypothetical protein
MGIEFGTSHIPLAGGGIVGAYLRCIIAQQIAWTINVLINSTPLRRGDWRAAMAVKKRTFSPRSTHPMMDEVGDLIRGPVGSERVHPLTWQRTTRKLPAAT